MASSTWRSPHTRALHPPGRTRGAASGEPSVATDGEDGDVIGERAAGEVTSLLEQRLAQYVRRNARITPDRGGHPVLAEHLASVAHLGQPVGVEQAEVAGVEGALPARGGRLALDIDYDLTDMNPARAIAAGIALVPGDRARDGGVASLSVGANLTLPVLDRYAGRHRLDRREMDRDAAALLARHDVRPAAGAEAP